MSVEQDAVSFGINDGLLRKAEQEYLRWLLADLQSFYGLSSLCRM